MLRARHCRRETHLLRIDHHVDGGEPVLPRLLLRLRRSIPPRRCRVCRHRLDHRHGTRLVLRLHRALRTRRAVWRAVWRLVAVHAAVHGPVRHVTRRTISVRTLRIS